MIFVRKELELIPREKAKANGGGQPQQRFCDCLEILLDGKRLSCPPQHDCEYCRRRSSEIVPVTVALTNGGTRQGLSYAIVRIAKKMGNAAKSRRCLAMSRDCKIQMKSSELTFMKEITPKTIATFDTPIRNLMSPATVGFLIALLLVCFGLAPMAQAVCPDTDGAIPGSNNGEGIGVLVSRTVGIWNTGTGFEALNNLTAGNQNTATGVRALSSDINGGFNTATGVYSLFSNTSGFFNSATGTYSLANNISGNYNTANGYGALYYNTEGDGNTATGFAALYRNTTGVGNTANGYQALLSNTASNFNTATGYQALYSNTSGAKTANGVYALFNSTT